LQESEIRPIAIGTGGTAVVGPLVAIETEIGTSPWNRSNGGVPRAEIFN
jgi:hypothetical protein